MFNSWCRYTFFAACGSGRANVDDRYELDACDADAPTAVSKWTAYKRRGMRGGGGGGGGGGLSSCYIFSTKFL